MVVTLCVTTEARRLIPLHSSGKNRLSASWRKCPVSFSSVLALVYCVFVGRFAIVITSMETFLFFCLSSLKYQGKQTTRKEEWQCISWRTKLQKMMCLVENWKHFGVLCEITGPHGEMLLELPPKLLLSGEIYFWKCRQAACSRCKFTSLWHLISSSPSTFFPPPPANFYSTHTYICVKANMPPQSKKLGVFILLLSLSPSGLLLLLCPGGVLLFSLGGVASQIAASGAACGALSAVGGEEKQWHLSARRKEPAGGSTAENKVEQ